MTVSRRDFASRAAFIAKQSAEWASDVLSLDNASEEMPDDEVDRFLSEIQMRLDYMRAAQYRGREGDEDRFVENAPNESA